jgi:cyclopropane fatty-acyl-phospholipid synthase-like methyltransferase
MKTADEQTNSMEEVYQDDICAFIGLKHSHMGYWHADNSNDFHRAQEDNLIHLLDPLNIQPDDRVLDIGGGQGGTAVWMAKRYNCKVVIVDIVENMIQKAHEAVLEAGMENQIEAICSDALKLKEPEASFDHIISVEALHHFSDKESLFYKVFFLLKSGGNFLASIYLSDMKPGFLKKLFLKLTIGDSQLSPVNSYLDAIKNSNFESSTVEDISEVTISKSYQKISEEPYYSKLLSYHRKHFGLFIGLFFPFVFKKWILSLVRNKMLRLVICRTKKTTL